MKLVFDLDNGGFSLFGKRHSARLSMFSATIFFALFCCFHDSPFLGNVENGFGHAAMLGNTLDFWNVTVFSREGLCILNGRALARVLVAKAFRRHRSPESNVAVVRARERKLCIHRVEDAKDLLHALCMIYITAVSTATGIDAHRAIIGSGHDFFTCWGIV